MNDLGDKPLFSLGQVLITPALFSFLARNDVEPFECLMQHRQGDWGLVCDEDKAANDAAVQGGNRLLSKYQLAGRYFWILTEADRSSTTLLFPDEY